jgi:hypothetical protein
VSGKFWTSKSRLRRATTLKVERLSENRFKVTGGKSSHRVTILDDGRPHCDCFDFAFREGMVFCGHICAVALFLCTDEDRAKVAEYLEIK